MQITRIDAQHEADGALTLFYLSQRPLLWSQLHRAKWLIDEYQVEVPGDEEAYLLLGGVFPVAPVSECLRLAGAFPRLVPLVKTSSEVLG